jgi:hypothetical protein
MAKLAILILAIVVLAATVSLNLVRIAIFYQVVYFEA